MKETVKISTEYIPLDGLLKFVGVAQTGGHAKIIIIDECVKINGEICTMRRKKVRPGDLVEIDTDQENIILTIEAE